MPRANLILHHYAISPYSQKIRAMLGYTQLAWQSVITAAAPPRPQLFPLAGGYRKIPVAQIGADVFCDSKLIAREIAAIAGREELLPENLSEDALALMRRAEGELFFACGLSSTGLKMIVKIFKMFSLAEYIHFMKDRMAMSKDSSLPYVSMKDSRRMVMRHLDDIEQRLQHDFLFGANPNLADFSVYHGIWMLHELGEKQFMRQFPKTVAWVERIQQFGIGAPTSIAAGDALNIARQSEPRAIDAQFKIDSAIGKTVAIEPTDYAKDATRGRLMASTPDSWVVAREDDSVGVVHVHFPKEGYALTLH